MAFNGEMLDHESFDTRAQATAAIAEYFGGLHRARLHCRLFAPMYRQVTLTSLRASLGGMASTADRTLGYRDVLAAWRSYLQNDNKGRGVCSSATHKAPAFCCS